MVEQSPSTIRPDLVDAARSGEVLAKIVARKRVDVAARMHERPLARFRRTLMPSDRSLLAALLQPRTRFILECKRASPSKGMIREDFDPVAIARAYAPFADAISVLTDEPYFSGSFDILRTVRAQVDVPVLCKDFVLCPYQVYEARGHGADAVLLMMSVLDDEAARQCLAAAAEVAVDCLVEVHDEAELARALALGATIIGINNRNLKTLCTDLAVTERLAAKVPADCVVVSESGVSTRRDVDRLAPHADAFLVGTSLMAQADLDEAVRTLLFGRIKVCGLRTVDQAVAVHNGGAVYGGLIFVDRSPRHIDLERARELVAAVPLRWVGVFVDETVDTVVDYTRTLGLRAVQLHGHETEDYIRELRARLDDPAIEIWRGVGIGAPAGQMPDLPTADRLLFDTKRAGQSGGTGQTFDWSVLTRHPRLNESVLAGGLTPANIVAARDVGTWALDVNSGVEDTPGRKSPAKLELLFQQLRGRCRTDLNSTDR